MNFIREFRYFRSALSALLHTSEKTKVVVFSEGNNHWAYIKPVVKYLESQSDHLSISYLTQSKSDAALAELESRTARFVLGNGAARDYVLNNIKCDLFITSTPDIGYFDVKRSPQATHYAYVQHSLNSLHMAYREHAFHQFDTVLCSTDYHIDEVHAICSHYGLDQKNVIPMRYEPIFNLALNTKHIPVDPRHTAEDEKLSILIAPTWGNSSLIESGVAEDVLAVLLENNFAVTLRPHPETSKHKPLLVTELSKRFRDYQDLTIDLDIESFQSVIDADILVTDWSGICFDFALGMSKPIIFFDTAPKIKNPDHFLIKQFVAEINLRKKLGLVVSTAADLPNAIEGIYNCKFKTEMSINDIFDQPASAAIGRLLENVKNENQTSP